MEHFAFPGNIDFAADDRRIFMYYPWKAHVFYETMFTIGESRATSDSDDTEQQAQQVAGNSRFLTETPLENAD